MSFQTQHVATLCKYAGISFVAGAVNHGFFSGERSVATAAAGVLCFLVGAAMEMKASPGQKRWADLLGFGVLASVGLGFFTGGLQHFPDSPERSAWVVPLGFVMSLAAVYFMEGRGPQAERPISPGALARYGAVASTVVVAGSVVAWQLLPPGLGHSHADGDDHSHGTNTAAHSHDIPAAQAADAKPGSVRVVVVEMNDTMRFSPATWDVQAGETVRIVAVNRGQVRHELVLGKPDELAKHQKEMVAAAKKGKAHHHHGPEDGALSVAPGQAAEMLWTFKEAGTFGMACFERGHYEAGMKGSVEVRPRT
jgi:uncharacterized cupredoxin-like copper-binding protein